MDRRIRSKQHGALHMLAVGLLASPMAVAYVAFDAMAEYFALVAPVLVVLMIAGGFLLLKRRKLLQQFDANADAATRAHRRPPDESIIMRETYDDVVAAAAERGERDNLITIDWNRARAA